MLKTSLRGQVRQTVLNKYKPLLPLFEAVINAFQAIQDAATAQGKLVIEIERERGLGLDDTPPIIGFNITDSGIGLNDTKCAEGRASRPRAAPALEPTLRNRFQGQRSSSHVRAERSTIHHPRLSVDNPASFKAPPCLRRQLAWRAK